MFKSWWRRPGPGRLETCPPMTISAVEKFKEWAEQLDEPYLQQALTKASKGPIRRTRRT